MIPGATLFIDPAPGETRHALFDADDQPIGFAVERVIGPPGVHLGAVCAGRVSALAASLGGVFVALPAGPDGMLALSPGHGLSQGAAVRVRVLCEAYADKGPRLSLVDADTPLTNGSAGLDAGLSSAVARVEASLEARVRCDEAEDAALNVVASVPGGGRVSFEPTRAFVAVDIDAGGRPAQANKEASARAINLAAAPAVARGLGLRALGGLVMIDLVHMRNPAARKQVAAAFRSAFAGMELEAQWAPVSRFCVLEAAVTRRRRPVYEVLLGEDGQPSLATRALRALRRLDTEAQSDRAHRLDLRAPPAVVAWIEAHRAIWNACAAPYGGRVGVTAAPDLGPDGVDIRRV